MAYLDTTWSEQSALEYKKLEQLSINDEEAMTLALRNPQGLLGYTEFGGAIERTAENAGKLNIGPGYTKFSQAPTITKAGTASGTTVSSNIHYIPGLGTNSDYVGWSILITSGPSSGITRTIVSHSDTQATLSGAVLTINYTNTYVLWPTAWTDHKLTVNIAANRYTGVSFWCRRLVVTSSGYSPVPAFYVEVDGVVRDDFRYLMSVNGNTTAAAYGAGCVSFQCVIPDLTSGSHTFEIGATGYFGVGVNDPFILDSFKKYSDSGHVNVNTVQFWVEDLGGMSHA